MSADAEERVPVDAWRLQEAFVEVAGKRYDCASMAGVPQAPEGVMGELVFVSRGGRREDGVVTTPAIHGGFVTASAAAGRGADVDFEDLSQGCRLLAPVCR